MVARNEQKLLNVPEWIPCCCIKQPTNAVCVYANGFILEIIYSFFSLSRSLVRLLYNPLFMFGFGSALRLHRTIFIHMCVWHDVYVLEPTLMYIDIFILYWCWYVDIVQEIHICECDWHSFGYGLVQNARQYLRLLVADASLAIIFAFNLICCVCVCVYERTFESTAKSIFEISIESV